jgi:mono/diheme cytochrome c family protein
MWWLLLLLVVLTGCWRGTLAPPAGPSGHSPPDRSTAQPVAMPVHKLTTGEVLFLRHCAGCHGAGARGDGPVATVLGLRPRNLRETGLFPEERDTAWITRILHGKAMPVSMQSSSTIATDIEVDALVHHLRRLPTIPWNDVDRGEEVYDSLCLSCHGVYGHGDGPVAKTLSTPPRNLMAPPYQQQISDEALFQGISDGHGAMPGTADVLSVDDRRAVVSFVRLLTPGYENYDRYCVGCHGNRGRPSNTEILELLGQADTWEPSPSFDQEFFRARTDEQLRLGVRRMLALNRAPMPHFAGELTKEEVRQVLGYLRTLPPES